MQLGFKHSNINIKIYSIVLHKLQIESILKHTIDFNIPGLP